MEIFHWISFLEEKNWLQWGFNGFFSCIWGCFGGVLDGFLCVFAVGFAANFQFRV